MGTPYLLDTNVIIYFLDAKLPDSVLDDIESKLNEFGSIMSVIRGQQKISSRYELVKRVKIG